MPMEVAQADLEDVLRAMPSMGFVGANVTIPHKESVLRLADIVTDRAALIGAANTLIFRQDGKILADNTDGYGFLANLRQEAPGWRADAGPCAVLGRGRRGAGGRRRASEAGAEEISLANRTRSRAEALRSDFGAKVVVYDWVQAGNAARGSGDGGEHDVARHGRASASSACRSTGCRRERVVTDLVYTPLDTALLVRAREIGLRRWTGWGCCCIRRRPGSSAGSASSPKWTPPLREAVLAA